MYAYKLFLEVFEIMPTNFYSMFISVYTYRCLRTFSEPILVHTYECLHEINCFATVEICFISSTPQMAISFLMFSCIVHYISPVGDTVISICNAHYCIHKFTVFILAFWVSKRGSNVDRMTRRFWLPLAVAKCGQHGELWRCDIL